MRAQRNPIFLFLILASLSASCNFLNTSDEDSGKPNVIPVTDDLRCERQPTATLVGEEISQSQDPCQASAKIQAIAYECGDPADTDAYQKSAFALNVEQARKRCTEFCQAQGEACEGVFSPPTDCGLKTPPSKALDFGKNVMHCRPSCKGQAFNYCSIYHGNFLATSDRSLFAKMKENCRCVKK